MGRSRFPGPIFNIHWAWAEKASPPNHTVKARENARPTKTFAAWLRSTNAAALLSHSSMGKQKQQIISRFFAPKSNPNSSPAMFPSPSPFLSPNPPKIAATVPFSPSKRSKALERIPTPPPSKKARTAPTPPSSLNHKFLQKFLEPTPLSLSAAAPSASSAKYTPLEQQVVELRARYPDVLLMVEVGYKYRFFGPDAETAARVLGIQAHMDHSFLTASIPTFRLQFHVRRLVNAG